MIEGYGRDIPREELNKLEENLNKAVGLINGAKSSQWRTKSFQAQLKNLIVTFDGGKHPMDEPKYKELAIEGQKKLLLDLIKNNQEYNLLGSIVRRNSELEEARLAEDQAALDLLSQGVIFEPVQQPTEQQNKGEKMVLIVSGQENQDKSTEPVVEAAQAPVAEVKAPAPEVRQDNKFGESADIVQGWKEQSDELSTQQEAPAQAAEAPAPVAEVKAEAPVAEVKAEAPVAEVKAEAPVAGNNVPGQGGDNNPLVGLPDADDEELEFFRADLAEDPYSESMSSQKREDELAARDIAAMKQDLDNERAAQRAKDKHLDKLLILGGVLVVCGVAAAVYAYNGGTAQSAMKFASEKFSGLKGISFEGTKEAAQKFFSMDTLKSFAAYIADSRAAAMISSAKSAVIG